ncbi:Suppressor of the cold-sensitive snRNP bioproteinsis mutant brr1-1, partial [Perkinsus olseni]
SASVSSFVNVRSVPDMVADRLGARRLSSTEKAVVDCLSNELAVDSMFTVIKTASVDCESTREELCQYLAEAGENLGLEVICEPNFAVELNGGLVDEAVRALPLAELNVNDEFSERQWNLELIGMNEAWEALEDRSLREVVVAVVDTGVDYRHKDLAGNMFAYENCSHGYNFVNGNSDVSDVQGHGTSCAGIFGAVTNNGVGVAGIAPVKIMALRVFNSDGRGFVADAIKALNYAVENGADLSSHSYATSSYSSAAQMAVTRAAQQGHLIISSSGNDGSDISVNKRYPCAYTEDAEILCVASSNSLDQLASHSNYAPFVDLAAPGEHVFVTDRNNGYTSKSGTSMAGPQVAGAAALLYGLGLSGSDVRSSLLASVDPLTDVSGNKIADFGRLNVAKAVEVASTKPTVPPKKVRSVGVC